MKAAVYRRYGPPEVVRIEDVATPVPGPGEVLVRVRAATVASADFRMRSLKAPAGFGPFLRPAIGLFAPRKKILGTDFAGIIEALGEGVTRFRAGDRVMGFPGGSMGSHAEYRVMPAEGRIVPIPDDLTFEDAAALAFGGTTALHFLLHQGKVRPGESVLVVGAAGAVGSAGVQIARYLGAEVTGVASGGNRDLVLSLGAQDFVDYREQDPFDGSWRYDVVFETVGSAGRARCQAALKPGGRLLLGSAGLGDTFGAVTRGGGRVIAGPAREAREDLEMLVDLVRQGAIKPVIDQVYPLEEIVAAHARVESGHKRGNVVVTFGN